MTPRTDGLRTEWTSVNPNIELFFEYHPFTFEYYGYIVQLKDMWVLWGNYFRNQSASLKLYGDRWEYSSFCDGQPGA